MRPKFPSTDGVACHDRHDGCGTHSYFLAASEQGVHEAAHEGGVEAVLGREVGHERVGDTLGVGLCNFYIDTVMIDEDTTFGVWRWQ